MAEVNIEDKSLDDLRFIAGVLSIAGRDDMDRGELILSIKKIEEDEKSLNKPDTEKKRAGRKPVEKDDIKKKGSAVRQKNVDTDVNDEGKAAKKPRKTKAENPETPIQTARVPYPHTYE